MDERNIFTRPSVHAVEPAKQFPLNCSFCRYCGLALDAHPEKQDEPEVKPEDRIEDVVYDPPRSRPVLCPETSHLDTIPRLPELDIQALLSSSSKVNPQPVPVLTSAMHDATAFSKDLIRWTDPTLVTYVQNLTRSFHLRAFDALLPQLDGDCFAPGKAPTLGPTLAAQDVVAPHALLGQCLRVLVKELVSHGVRTAKVVAEQVQNRRRTELIAQAFAAGDPFPSIPTSALNSSAKQVLTPSHVLKALPSPSPPVSHLRLSVGRPNIRNPALAFRPAPTTYSMDGHDDSEANSGVV